MQLTDLTQTPCLFIGNLREICEIIFDLMLKAYISSLEAFHNCSKKRSAQQPRQSLGDWERTFDFADKALEKSRDAEMEREAHGDLERNRLWSQAMKDIAGEESDDDSLIDISGHPRPSP